MVRTDAFIRSRKLSGQEVAKFNYVLKARARRYIAAGRKEWLYPEEKVADPWEKFEKLCCRRRMNFGTSAAKCSRNSKTVVSTIRTSLAGPRNNGSF